MLCTLPLLTNCVCLAEMATQHIGGVTILTELQFQQIYLYLAVLDKQAMLHNLQIRGTGEGAGVPHQSWKQQVSSVVKGRIHTYQLP